VHRIDVVESSESDASDIDAASPTRKADASSKFAKKDEVGAATRRICLHMICSTEFPRVSESHGKVHNFSLNFPAPSRENRLL